MSVDSLLAPAPLTLTRQIVEQTSNTIERVRETVDEILLEGPDTEDQSLARPETRPVGASSESSESGQQGQPDGDGDANDSGAAGNTSPFRGKALNTVA